MNASYSPLAGKPASDVQLSVPQARLRIASAQKRIVQALEARDVDNARNWMAKHIRDFRKGYEIAEIDLELRITAD